MTDAINSSLDGFDAQTEPSPAGGVRSYAIRLALAALLLTAAAFKAQALIADSLAFAASSPRWMNILVIGAEFALAVWLLSNIAPALARWAAILAFTAFACFALVKAVSGDVSCGCFGNAALSPWISFSLDVLAVAALLLLLEPSPRDGAVRRLRVIVWLLPAATIASIGAVKILRAAEPASHSAAGLRCESNLRDFGKLSIAEARNLQHSFFVRNISDRPIRITNTQATCGCTGSSAPTDPIAPHATATVQVKANWADRPGARSESVHLFTDAPGGGHLELKVKGVVEALAAVRPAALDFGAVSFGESDERDVYVHDSTQGGTPLEIISVVTGEGVSVARTGPDGASDSSLPLPGGPGRFRIRLTNDGTRSGPKVQSVQFHTNHPEQATLLVSVRALLAPAIDVTPRSVLFRPATANGTFPVQTVIVTGVAGVEPEVRVSGEGFRLEAVRSLPNERSVISVRYLGKEVPGAARGKLSISAPDRPPLEVPLMAVSF